ncbi:TonB-dependent receptor domain-containing protein [Pseudoduganella violaceinigra]|uniref:TonB-dependent receptor domain-containing protein n=1 Tax=Pseudoduganella violaceinigra TaxID=246602 RepID=UPI0003F797BE|nr:TonB-dependent receptor [Pseudoduganella violaceinigra]
MTASVLRPQRLALLLAAALGANAHAQETTRLGEILVTAKPEENKTITARELERRGVTDMAQMARYETLVTVPAALSGGANIWDGAGNTGFNIRGVEGNRIGLDLDGIALPDAAPRPDNSTLNSFGVGRDYFDPETFREVRIGAGSTAADGGSAGLGGKVSFVTKSPSDFVSAEKPVYAEYKFGYHGANDARMHALTGAVQSGSLQALAVAVRRNGEQSQSEGSVAPNPDDWRSDALLAKLAWRLAPGQKLGFTFDGFRAGHDRKFDNKLNAMYPQGAAQASNTHRNRASLEHEYTSGTWLVESRAYVQNSRVEDHTDAAYVAGPQRYARSIDTGYFNKSKGLASSATRQFGADSMSFGAMVEDQASRRPWREDRTVLASGAHQVTNKNRMADMDTLKLSAFVRGEYVFPLAGLRATVSPGLRAEYRKLEPKNLQNYVIAVPAAAKELKDDSDSFLSPSLGLTVAVTPQVDVYGKYTHGYRMPTAAERTGTYDSFSYTGAGNGYATLGNANLGKESSNTFELGLRGQAASWLTVSASTFYNRYKDFIEYVAQPADPVNFPTVTFGLFRPENIGNARSWGGEFSALAQMGQGFSAALSAGASRGTLENKRTGQKGGMNSIQPYKATASLAWDDPQKRGGASLTAVHMRGKQAQADVTAAPAQAPAGAYFAVPAATVVDLAGYWNIGRNAVLNAGIYNVGDKKYWDYAAARSLAAGSTAAARAEIERQARPGRHVALNFKLMY